MAPIDWVVIGTGVLAMLFSFFSYYTHRVRIAAAGVSFSQTASVTAWHGLFGWFAAVLAFLSSGLLAAQLIGRLSLPFQVRLGVLAGYGLATLCVLLGLLVVPGHIPNVQLRGFSVDEGHGLGYWLSLLTIAAGTALSYLRLRQTSGVSRPDGPSER